MRRTMADVHREEGERRGELRGKRQTLFRLLRKRFGTIPDAVTVRLEAEQDMAQLDHWLDNFATAKRLADVGIE